ncbi:MAG: hypothetical protein KDA42_04680 [Planctomycetales bacterium]|nr:hypothetical protein [Planctomycetales bacterium]
MVCGIAATTSLPSRLWAAEEKPSQNASAAEKEKKPEHEEKEPVVTHHTMKIGGQEIAFTATAGRIAQKADDGKEKAHVFFVAYTKDGVDDVSQRPVTFCFNGGPGSSSVWLHLGMAGPWKVVIPDDASTPRPPFTLEANPHSLLDLTDLVFIDPVSTGYSRPAEGEKKEQFHGYEEDIHSVAQFIHDYTTKYGRWSSPKFLIGESYGGIRAAGLSGWLQSRYKLELNGAIIISGVINFQTIRFQPTNDLAYISFLPSYAATAWYHEKLPQDLQALSLEKLTAEAEEFAAGAYATALLKGTAISAGEKQVIAREYARFTGLSPRYVQGANLRVSMDRFAKELLRSQRRTVGRFDSRFVGIDHDTVGGEYEYDASAAAISGAFTAAMNSYLRETLNYTEDRVYEVVSGNVHPWNYDGFQNRYVDASETLRQAMIKNPYLQVFAACGYYDLATPSFGMELTRTHLGLAPERAGNFRMAYYQGGHMMYIYEPSLKKLHRDLTKFYADTANTR